MADVRFAGFSAAFAAASLKPRDLDEFDAIRLGFSAAFAAASLKRCVELADVDLDALVFPRLLPRPH